MKQLLWVCLMVIVADASARAGDMPAPIKVAFVLSDGATVIDFAGPWEVFQDTEATTHHDYTDKLATEFPRVNVVRSVRFVQSEPLIYTASGLTSGVDLALHIVEGYFGREVARKTAEYMEYQSTAWKTP